MKNLMLAIFASFIYVGAYAQTDSSEKKLMPPDYENDSLNNSNRKTPTQRGDSLQNNSDRNSAHPDRRQDGTRNMNKTNSGGTGTNSHHGHTTPVDNTRTGDTRTNNSNNTNNTNNPVKVNPTQDGVIIMNGKTMVVKNGQSTAMNQPVNLTNGSRIMPDGTLIDKDGSSVKLKEGDYLDFTGQYIHRNPSNAAGTGAGYDKDKNQAIDKDKESKDIKPKDKNMYLVPDSTLKNKKVD